MIRLRPPVTPDSDLFAAISATTERSPHVGVRQRSEIPSAGRGRRSVQRAEARALLARLLVSLHGSDAVERWPLARTDRGQPYLQGVDAPRVSLAHSGPWVACATIQRGRVGVDVEVVKPRNWDALQAAFLHPSEAEWVMAVGGRERDLRAYVCWCRKEAWVKALGIGLTIPLERVVFSSDGRLVATPDEIGPAEIWRSEVWQYDAAALLAVVWAED